jgi:CRP/FNR family transcriptional regulator, transcriptional activator FtrB
MRPEDLPDVRALDLFADMETANFEELMQAAYLQRFPPQVQLIAEGEPADFLHVVVEGTVELFAKANNRETTTAIIEPVSTFILAAVLRDAVYLMSARTLAPARILLIPSENIRAVFERDAAFARSMVGELAARYRDMVKLLKNQKLRASVERLANYLIAEHRKQGANGSVSLPVDKRILAALLGMTPENLSRAFSTLAPYGVVVNGAEIALNKLKDLETLAKPTPLIDDPDT